MIGRGGMGVVYKARDPQLDRLVAIKMIIGANPALLKRFDTEARSTGSLQHQNIVTIYDFGNQDGNPYLVMEFLEGMSLESAISSARPMTLSNKLSICIDVCNGLSYAHQRGIIHRDIKPANVMLLNDDNIKIVDFGIARIGDTGISRTEVVGSLNYMSPEQFQTEPLDFRTDIFSTGVVLYRLLTGVLPFEAAGEAAVMYRIIHESPAPLSSYLQDYPAELDSIVGKALAKNRDNRYATCKDLAFDLLLVQEQLKHTEVVQWMQRAEAAVQKTDWTKAEDYLRQLLKIEKNHTHAHRMLGEVQERVRQERRVGQLRQLRIQVDEAFLSRRYDDALIIVGQALSIDATNRDLLLLKESIQEAKAQAARMRAVLRRAEEAQLAGDLDEAKKAIGEALTLDPQETSAKALQLVIFKQAEEQERQRQLRQLLDNARDQISARDINAAFETLRVAATIDPASVEMLSLLKVVHNAREQQKRKAEVDKLTGQIEEALAHEDYQSASAIAAEGLRQHPNEPGLQKLKELADEQLRRREQKAYAREQFILANSLMEGGKTLEALSVTDKALEAARGDNQLEALRSVIKDQLTFEEARKRKQQMLQRADDAIAANDFDQAVRILEDVRREFPGDGEYELSLERARTAQANERRIVDASASAQRMLNESDFDRAVQFLDSRIKELPDARLSDLLQNARRQREQFQARVLQAVEQGKRILDEHGGAEAARYLETQPDRYSQTPEFHAFAQAVAVRRAREALDQDLSHQTDPDIQLRLAEAALRKNPDNAEIKEKLAAVRLRRQQIAASVEGARSLEASTQYAAAAEELSRLCQIYPDYPNLAREIQRLRSLEKQRQDLLARSHQRNESSVIDAVPQVEAINEEDAGATQVLGQTPTGAHPYLGKDRITGSTGISPTEQVPRIPPDQIPTEESRGFEQVPPDAKARPLGMVVGAVAVILIVLGAGFLIYRSTTRAEAVAVSISPMPDDSTVEVDGQSCPAPCRLHLVPGPHEVKASHAGYETFSQQIQVTSRGQTSFPFALSAAPSSPVAASNAGVEPSTKEKQSTSTIRNSLNNKSDKLATSGTRDSRANLGEPRSNGNVNSAIPATVTGSTNSNPPASTPPTSQPPSTPTAALPITVKFAVSPQQIQKGEKATLTWEVQNATNITLDGQPVKASDSKSVSPSEPATTYRLVATAPGGREVDRENVVIVNSPVPSNSVSESPGVSDQDKKAISDLLQRYSQSYADRNAKLVQELWPGISKDYLKRIKSSYDAHLRISFSNLRFSRLADGKVEVACTQSVQSDQAKLSSTKPNFSILVNERGGNWVINNIPLNDQ
jgi:serine/threonine-protein kinase